MEAIVAKYLSPKQTPTTKARKHLIKRPYGMSVTDVDVLSENIRKQHKKSSNKSTKRKSTVFADTETSKKRLSRTNRLSKTVSNVNNPQAIPLSEPPFRSCHHDHSVLDPVSSVDFQSTTDTLLRSEQTSYVLQPLQNASTSICGSCQQCIDMTYLGGYCAECNIPICWSCWSSETLPYYRCLTCQSFNFIN